MNWWLMEKGALNTSGRDLDDGIVGMLDLGLRYLSDADFEGLLVVNCFHHGGCCGRHDCGRMLMNGMGILKKGNLKYNISSDRFSP